MDQNVNPNQDVTVGQSTIPSYDDLAKFAAAADQAGVPMQHGTMQPTQNGKPVEASGEKTKTEKVKKEKIDEGAALAAVLSGVSLTKENAVVSPDSPKGQLQAVMQKLAVHCGFIVPKDHTLKISCTKTKDGRYDIKAKDAMSTKILGDIIRYPDALYKAIVKCNSSKGLDVTYAYEDGTPEYFAEAKDLVMVTKIFSHDDAISWINRVCGGRISEAEDLYAVVKRQNTKTGEITVKDRADCIQRYFLDSQIVALKTRIETTTDEKAVKKLRKQLESKKASVMFKLRSEYRPRLLTQNNYIALAKAIVEPVGKMSAEEAEIRNKFYIERMFSTDKGAQKLQNLTEFSRPLVAQNGDKFTSKFFQAEGESALLTTRIAPWYDKFSVIGVKDLRIPRLEMIPSVKNPDNKRPRECFRDIEISGTGYRFDPEGEHKAVYNATQGTLTGDMVMAFKADLATNQRSSASAKQAMSINADAAFQGLLAMLTA